MVKASCCFCRFNVISVFFQLWQWLWPQPQDAAYCRYALDWQQQCPTKKQLASFQRHPCTLIFVVHHHVPSHEHKSFTISATSLSPKKKQPSSKDPHLWGWHVAERCYARLLAIYPSDQRLHSNCWDPPPRWHRDSYVSSRWWLTAPGGWNYVLKLGGPKNKRVQMSPFTFWYFTKGPMPQSIPVILLKVFLSTPYRHDAYQHNSPLKEELKMQFFFTAPRKDVHHGARFANDNPRWCPPRESPISVEEDDNFVGVRPPHCRSQARSVSENRVIGWCWNYCMVPCDFWMMTPTHTHKRFLLGHWMSVNSNHWSNQSYSHKYGQSDKERESLFNETCHSADSCSD